MLYVPAIVFGQTPPVIIGQPDIKVLTTHSFENINIIQHRIDFMAYWSASAKATAGQPSLEIRLACPAEARVSERRPLPGHSASKFDPPDQIFCHGRPTWNGADGGT